MKSHGKFVDRVAARLEPLVPRGSSILVGLSGGLDSVVLLHLLRQLASTFSWRLTALHVHHGISTNADAWAEFCTRLCNHYAIPLKIERVQIGPLRSHGVEAAARKLRHQALAAQQCDFIALAHHADDQSETLLLQLLRGAGVRGSAAMPVLASQRGGPACIRPLLNSARSEILDYATDNGLYWIDDESNGDDYYPRNFLRHRVLPILEEKFPAYRETLSRSTSHFAEASQLLDELAAMDGAAAIDQDGLLLAPMRRLSILRAKNLFRYYLHSRGILMPQQVRLTEMLRQLLDARQDAAVNVQFGDYQIRRYMDKAYVMPVDSDFDRNFALTWNGEATLPWPPQHTRLIFSEVTGAGISMQKLQGTVLTARLRSGSDEIRPHPRAAKRTLKNLLQQHRIPPWQRERLPMLYAGGRLVSVVGVAVDADYQVQDGEAGLLVSTE